MLAHRDNGLETPRRVADLLSRMTPAEKVDQALQIPAQDDLDDPGALVTRQNVGSLLHIPPDRMGLAKELTATTRRGISPLLADSRMHGPSFRAVAATFGRLLAVASGWRPKNARRTARATAMEAPGPGFTWTISPVPGIARDLRWERAGGTFDEDPYLSGGLEGFQEVPLGPGDSVEATLDLAVSERTVVDAGGVRVVEPGDFEVLVGPDSRNTSPLDARFAVVA